MSRGLVVVIVAANPNIVSFNIIKVNSVLS